MSTMSYNRAAHQHINPALHCGKPKGTNHPQRPSTAYLDRKAYDNTNHVIDLLRKAQMASSHASCMVNLTAAYTVLRDVLTENR